MASIRNHIYQTLFAALQGDGGMVPKETIIAKCRSVGYDEEAVRVELDSLVKAGDLCAVDGHVAPATEPGEEPIAIETYRGDESTPWQFAVTQTMDELLIEQARGPPEKFDPVEKRFTIENQPVGDDPVEFHHAVSRRVWQEDPEQPHVKSQRNEGRVIELFYRDPDGRHLDKPEPESNEDGVPEAVEFEPTGHPGLTVSSTFIRSEEGDDLKFTEEREYRLEREILDQYAEVYVLSYYELNEESTKQAVWEIDDAVAYRLVLPDTV
ncbi:hypothetical protein NDI85_02055 [Halomicroarcula sp. S1AR25-4]|uniref:hypothetical protein n=1 Tax=Haloarcula sp. S1AR25-4 TaxID=2950538 RepID=UPI002874AB12|nr:hypothetical protein [Halomicroarcula sp. S1AR25-4]MDS0276564.1 hypothetical protein [Halomicroarcula sp. S1AR25-4]